MKSSFKFQLLILSLLSFSLSSCLKDEDYEDGLRGVSPDENSSIVEIEGPQKGFYNLDLIVTDVDTTIETFVTIRLSSNEPAGKDIQVTLTMDPTLVATYNAVNGTNYVVPAGNLYTIPSLTITIPKGQRRGFVKLTTRASNLLGSEYALGIRLASISDPEIKLSGNFNKQVIAFAIRNKYDGKYSLTIKTVGWDAYGISSGPTLNWPNNINLVTASANSITFEEPVYITNLQPAFTSGGGATFFGGTTPLYTFNTSTNAMTSVVNTTPDDGRGRTLKLNPAVTDSRYDPVAKKIYAAYLMTQNGRPDQEIYMTFTYIGPR